MSTLTINNRLIRYMIPNTPVFGENPMNAALESSSSNVLHSTPLTGGIYLEEEIQLSQATIPQPGKNQIEVDEVFRWFGDPELPSHMLDARKNGSTNSVDIPASATEKKHILKLLRHLDYTPTLFDAKPANLVYDTNVTSNNTPSIPRAVPSFKSFKSGSDTRNV
jgi:hypothetical protein